jgi:hypothetical protein
MVAKNQSVNLKEVFSDAALVCRGGTCTAKKFISGTGVQLDLQGKLLGVSVNSASNASLKELTKNIPHRNLGVTNIGKVREMGGEVTPAPTSQNPYHGILSGITPQQAEGIFTPTVRNPNLQ